MSRTPGPPQAVGARRCRETLVQWITTQGLAPGSRLPAERDLAHYLGTTRDHVHAALRILTTDGLVQRESRKIRVWAGNPVAVADGGIVVVCDMLDCALPGTDQEAPGTHQLHHGVLAEIRRRGLGVSTLSHAVFIQRGLSGLPAPRGVLVMPGRERSRMRDLVEAIARLRLPTVVADEEIPAHAWRTLTVDAVLPDQAAGAEAIVRHLHARGRRHLRMVLHRQVGTVATETRPWIEHRLEGMRRGCAACGLPCLPPLEVLCMPYDAPPERWRDDQVTLAIGGLAEIAQSNDCPDALMLLSDGETFAAAAACRRLGLIPGRDIDITGFDHCAHHAMFDPQRRDEPSVPQASVDRRMRDVGIDMVRVLCDRMANRLPPLPVRHLVPGRLVTWSSPPIGLAEPSSQAPARSPDGDQALG